MDQSALLFAVVGSLGSDRAYRRQPHERTISRPTQRNGSRGKTVTTGVGDVTAKMHESRVGSFFPSLLEPRWRIEVALRSPSCSWTPRTTGCEIVERVVSQAVVVATGVSADGRRDPLVRATAKSHDRHRDARSVSRALQRRLARRAELTNLNKSLVRPVPRRARLLQRRLSS